MYYVIWYFIKWYCIVEIWNNNDNVSYDMIQYLKCNIIPYHICCIMLYYIILFNIIWYNIVSLHIFKRIFSMCSKRIQPNSTHYIQCKYCPFLHCCPTLQYVSPGIMTWTNLFLSYLRMFHTSYSFSGKLVFEKKIL